MHQSSSSPRLSQSRRFRLSARGHTTEAAYRTSIAAAKGPTRRVAFEDARASWAHSHGLEPDDGAYLGELTSDRLSLRQLGEALAICGQTREMVLDTVGRLMARGFVEPAPKRELALTPLELAQGESVAADLELQFLRTESDGSQTHDRCMITPALREAMFRAVAARRFLVTLSEPAVFEPAM